MEKAVWKAAVNREVNNCVYNWTSDRITGRFATANEVKSVTSHEVINSNALPYISELNFPTLDAGLNTVEVAASNATFTELEIQAKSRWR